LAEISVVAQSIKTIGT